MGESLIFKLTQLADWTDQKVLLSILFAFRNTS